MQYLSCSHVGADRLEPCEAPWKFDKELPSVEVRTDYEARQAFIQSKQGLWHFWTLCHAVVPALRVNKSKQNSSGTCGKIWGFVADVDPKEQPMEFDTLQRVLSRMPVQPTWVERSLGGKGWHVIWEFEKPVITGDVILTVLAMQFIAEKLQVDKLPFVDSASTDPTKLWTNGARWQRISDKRISAATIQQWTVEIGAQFQSKDAHGVAVPLDVAYAELKKKYGDNFWPESQFRLEAQGPSFFIEGSTSAKSAWIKEHGIYTFADHVPDDSKRFFPWGHPLLLGPDKIKEFETINIARATDGIYYDGHDYWFQNGGKWVCDKLSSLVTYWKEACHLNKQDEINAVRLHVERQNRVDGIGPALCHPHGVIDNYPTAGSRFLNTYVSNHVEPAPEAVQWGEKFPRLARFFDTFLTQDDDKPVQKFRLLLELQRRWHMHLEHDPMQQQAMFICGPAGVGKTFFTDCVLGLGLGAATDASSYLIERSQFNGALLCSPVWSLHDPVTESNFEHHSKKVLFDQILKRTVASSSIVRNEKYQTASAITFNSLLICTMNLDAQSIGRLPELNSGNADKFNLFVASGDVDHSVFEDSTNKNRSWVQAELPFFVSWLMRWNPPEWCDEAFPKDTRWGRKSFHHWKLAELSSGYGNNDEAYEALLVLLHTLSRTDADKEKGVYTVKAGQLLQHWRASDVARGPRRMSALMQDLQDSGYLRFNRITKHNSIKYYEIYVDSKATD